MGGPKVGLLKPLLAHLLALAKRRRKMRAAGALPDLQAQQRVPAPPVYTSSKTDM
jgi:hypothetical protein